MIWLGLIVAYVVGGWMALGFACLVAWALWSTLVRW